MNIVIMPNLQKTNAFDYTNRVCKKLFQLKINVHMYRFYQEVFTDRRIHFHEDFDSMIAGCDCIITIGGDGTIIHSAKHAAIFHKPLLGINCGRMGFMAGLEIDEIDRLSQLISGEYQVENRMMLSVQVEKRGLKQQFYALNDAVVSKGDLSRMVDLTVEYNGKKFCDYRADGLILATPTGSTAYSLSAGGPVIDPLANNILLTPICPHSLFSRSILFSEEAQLRVFPAERQKIEVFLTVDGEKSITLEVDDSIQISRAELYVELIRIKSQLFYDVLTSKFLGGGN